MESGTWAFPHWRDDLEESVEICELSTGIAQVRKYLDKKLSTS